MAEEFLQSKTEAPTQRRREEAREQGRVSYSAELSAGLLLLGAIVTLWLGAHVVGTGLLENLRAELGGLRPFDMTVEQATSILRGLLSHSLELIGAFLGIVFALSLGTGFLQVGIAFTPQLLGPRWERLSAVGGFSRIFSLAGIIRGVVAVVKVAVIAAIAYWVLNGKATQIKSLGLLPMGAAAAQGWDITLRLALAIAAALLLVGLADFVYQRWRFEQSLWMTKQELKEEIKREEADPLIKARTRKLQREVARKQMFREVPTATVVLTNPTHLAVALRYERGKMAAPRVVAKGAGYVAQHIVEIARRHAVPVVERKPVAQVLFKAVRVGQEIPAKLYYVVAEILAFVYRLRNAV